jgi:hypothetical protein
MFQLKQKITTALLFSTLLFITACDKNDDDNNPQEDRLTLSGAASASQEVPTNTSTGTGSISGSYHKENNSLEYTITWSGLSGAPSMMHFHGPAPAGQNAGVAMPITGFTAAATGSVSGTATLTDTQETDLLAGNWYYNLHTAANPGGEIRGQITAR